LPGRRALAGCILSSHSEELQCKQAIDAKKEEVGNTLAFDGWKNINHQEVLGSVLITSRGKVLIWGAEDISGDNARTIDVVEKIKSFFARAESDDIKIIAVVTDSASAYASARLVLTRYRENYKFRWSYHYYDSISNLFFVSY